MIGWSKNYTGGNRYSQDRQEDQRLDGKRCNRRFKSYEISNSTKCIQDRVKWKEVVEKAKTFKQ